MIKFVWIAVLVVFFAGLLTAFMNDFKDDDEPGDGEFTQWKQEHIGGEDDENRG